jgi:hypothetical protein
MRAHGGSSALTLWRKRHDRAVEGGGILFDTIPGQLSHVGATAPTADSVIEPSPAAMVAVVSPCATRDRLSAAGELPALPGFRHFIATPQDSERFTLGGKPFDPSDSASWARAESLMGKLAALCRMPPVNMTNDGTNRGLPSGYTYFLQLIAHDLVHSSVLLSRTRGRLYGLANVRRMPLRLETVYGGGPAQCPHAYQADANLRHLLRLGQTRRLTEHGKSSELIPERARDVPRSTPGTAEDAGGKGYSEALTADPRNDSHAIISQLVVLFHMLHNTIVDRLNTDGHVLRLEDKFADIERRFVAAQTACILIYRAIIRRDLLPKILHDRVRKAYEEGTVPILEARNLQPEWRAPLELTHGVLRFGHAMVRSRYSLNELTPFPVKPDRSDDNGQKIEDILLQSSETAAPAMPFERKWIVDWRHFFGDDAVNRSMLIEPWATSLLDEAVVKHDRSAILIERDLLSSIAVQPWSVQALVKELQKTHAGILSTSPFLTHQGQPGGDASRPPWHRRIFEWLMARAARDGQPPTRDEIDQLARDPPLPLFVRFEAGTDGDSGGGRLGALGSIVIADVFYGVLGLDPLLGIDGRAELPVQLASLSRLVFDRSSVDHEKVFGFIGDMKTFPDLLRFLGRQIEFPTTD